MRPESPSLLRCPGCRARNRVARERVPDGPTCSRCHAPLVPGTPAPFSESEWQTEVDAAPMPVLVDFWAPWCGPCRTMGPVLDQVAAAAKGRLKVLKLNVDQNPGASARFGVQAIPTLILFDRGQVRDEIRGAIPRQALMDRLERHL